MIYIKWKTVSLSFIWANLGHRELSPVWLDRMCLFLLRILNPFVMGIFPLICFSEVLQQQKSVSETVWITFKKKSSLVAPPAPLRVTKQALPIRNIFQNKDAFSSDAVFFFLKKY